MLEVSVLEPLLPDPTSKLSLQVEGSEEDKGGICYYSVEDPRSGLSRAKLVN